MLCSFIEKYPLAIYGLFVLMFLFLVYKKDWEVISSILLGCTLLAGAQIKYISPELLFFATLDVLYVLYALCVAKIPAQKIESFGFVAIYLLLIPFAFSFFTGHEGEKIGFVFLSLALTFVLWSACRYQEEA